MRRFRERNATTPIVLMGYANPIEAMGIERFADARARRGRRRRAGRRLSARGSRRASRQLLEARGIAPIFLLAPTTPESRIAAVARLARGYVYYVSLKGVTGAGHLDTGGRRAQARARSAATCSIPVGVGFGIRDAASAQAIAAHADAVVIGSRIIQEIEAGPAADAPQRAGAWLAGIRTALDSMQRRAA